MDTLREILISKVFFTKNNLNLIMGRHQTNPNYRMFYKICKILQKCQGHENQKKGRLKNCHK